MKDYWVTGLTSCEVFGFAITASFVRQTAKCTTSANELMSSTACREAIKKIQINNTNFPKFAFKNLSQEQPDIITRNRLLKNSFEDFSYNICQISSTRRKTSQSKDENQQQTQPTYDAGSGNQTRDTLVEGQRSHHCANSAHPIQ